MARRSLRVRAIGLLLALAGSAAAEEPARPEPEETDEVRFGWSDGRTTLQAQGLRLELSNRLQVRWTGEWPGEDDRTRTGSFRVRRARTKLSGWAYSERIGFTLQVDWARPVGILQDAFVDLDATGDGALRIRLGQYKVPFGRQSLTSSGRLQFLSRSITSLQFARERDVGVMLHGASARGRLSWAAGAFNGSGPGVTRNDDGRYQLDARVQLAPGGDPGYTEADLGRSPRPLYAFAVQVERNDAGLGDERRRTTTWGADGILRYRGLFFLAELFRARLELPGGETLRRDGFTVQAGYLLGEVELAGRLARWKPGPGDERGESGAALSWYPHGHRLKLQADLRHLDGGPAGLDDTQLRFQTQLVF